MTTAPKQRYLAVDLGAESGRVVCGTVDAGGVALREIHRFANVPVRLPDGIHWNVLRLFDEMLRGIELALLDDGAPVVSVGVDSWGVDYGLFDSGGRLLGNPYHYRDARTDGVAAAYAQRVSAQRQYERTGIAQLPINTLYQLTAQCRDERPIDVAATLLLVPDIMHYWLSGERALESTNASTTGALGVDGSWADELIAASGAPPQLLSAPVEAGTTLGRLRPQLDLPAKARDVRVVLPATHDTACAVLAAPLHRVARGESCAYISSGTWSLLGLELDAPILTEAARLAGFTNERGVSGSIRFLRNIMGLWLVQECRRAWRGAGADYTYDALTERAGSVASPGLIVDVDDPALLHPADMPAAIAEQLARSGQRIERDPVEQTRAIFEGLALQYRRSIEDAERLAARRVGAIAIVGGGSRNAVLCQLAADACGRVVYAGPAEASATGNILMQAVAGGTLDGLAEIRTFVQTTGGVRTFEPRTSSAIDWPARASRVGSMRAERAPEIGAHA